MMGVLTFYTTFIERGHFLVALDKDKAGIDPDNTWKIASQLKRYSNQLDPQTGSNELMLVYYWGVIRWWPNTKLSWVHCLVLTLINFIDLR